MSQAIRGWWSALVLLVVSCGSRTIGGLDVEHGFSGAGGAEETGGWTSVGGAAGYGGWPSGGGSTGTGGLIPSCVPGQSMPCACASGLLGAQTCRKDGTYDACVCADAGSWEQQQFARIKQGMVGTWIGTQTNPWDEGCPTTLTFEANGHYSGHSPADTCVVFNYGTNDDSPEKTYQLTDVHATGEGWGEIQIYFSPGDTNQGELRHVALSPDGNLLNFECWKGEYGPLVFSLKRLR
jgi:hypothetical protein